MASPKIRKLKRLKRLRNLGLTNKSATPKEAAPVEVVKEAAPVEVVKEAAPVKKKATKKKKLWSSIDE